MSRLEETELQGNGWIRYYVGLDSNSAQFLRFLRPSTGAMIDLAGNELDYYLQGSPDDKKVHIGFVSQEEARDYVRLLTTLL